MRNLSKLIVSGLLVVSPILFTACNDDDRVGRDRNVPNNIEDNYSGDADRNRTGENEEEVKQGVRDLKNSAVNTRDNIVTTAKSASSSLESRIEKLEKEIMELKSKKVGPDRMGTK